MPISTPSGVLPSIRYFHSPVLISSSGALTITPCLNTCHASVIVSFSAANSSKKCFDGLTCPWPPRQSRRASLAIIAVMHATGINRQYIKFRQNVNYGFASRFQRALAAFLARAFLAFALIVSRLFFPPIFPPFRPISAMMRDTCSLLSVSWPTGVFPAVDSSTIWWASWLGSAGRLGLLIRFGTGR